MVYAANWVIIYHLPPIKGTRNSYWHCMHGIFDDWCICVVSDSIDVGKDSLHRVGLSFPKRIYKMLWLCTHLAGVFFFSIFRVHPQKLTMTMENQPFNDFPRFPCYRGIPRVSWKEQCINSLPHRWTQLGFLEFREVCSAPWRFRNPWYLGKW